MAITEKQRERRQKSIGGSDIAGVPTFTAARPHEKDCASSYLGSTTTLPWKSL